MFKMLTCFSSPRFVNHRVRPEISSEFTHCLHTRNKHMHKMSEVFLFLGVCVASFTHPSLKQNALIIYFLKANVMFHAQTKPGLDFTHDYTYTLPIKTLDTNDWTHAVYNSKGIILYVPNLIHCICRWGTIPMTRSRQWYFCLLRK